MLNDHSNMSFLASYLILRIAHTSAIVEMDQGPHVSANWWRPMAIPHFLNAVTLWLALNDNLTKLAI